MAAVSAKYTLETKRQAVEYFNSNNVPKHVEELLNKMFKEKPEDIFGYMSEHFGAIAKSPTITNVSAKEVLSSRGHPSVKLELNCFVNGVKKDREAWTKLNQRIGEKCFVIGNELYRRNPSILATGVTEKLSSVALLSADNANTVTELWEKIRAVSDQGGLVMLSKGQVEDVNTLAVDFVSTVVNIIPVANSWITRIPVVLATNFACPYLCHCILDKWYPCVTWRPYCVCCYASR
ncbi:predicted protein [Nematostella vectensis]|uniref:Enolase 4 n=1 Tax=Nematostella vectensis TaxID=45351 RepID=A7RIB6_NEMVE|nr:predicted protein [Nematostella vectensis]|eukprot:XP_001640738.1 predicted protein [Nematostella vectensis]